MISELRANVKGWVYLLVCVLGFSAISQPFLDFPSWVYQGWVSLLLLVSLVVLRQLFKSGEKRGRRLLLMQRLLEGGNELYALMPVGGTSFKNPNDAWETVLGWTPEEVESMNFLEELVHPEDVLRTVEEKGDVEGGSRVYRFKNRYRTKPGTPAAEKGEYRWLQWCGAVLDGKNIYAVARDVTQEVEFERRLFLSSAIYDEAAEMYGLMKAGSDYYTSVNKAWTDVLGWTPEEIESTRFQDLMHPEDLPGTDHVKEESESGVPLQGYRNRYRTKPGSLAAQKGPYRTIEWRGSLIGEYMYGVGRDVTGEIARIKEREEAKELIDLSLSFIRIQEGKKVLWANKALLSWSGSSSEGELCAKGVESFIHPEDLATTREAQGQLLSGCASSSYRNRWRHKTGEYRWVSWSAVSADPGKIYFVGSDVHDTHQALAVLRRSNADLERVASASVHQLKSGPRSIVGLAEEILWESPELPEEHREMLLMIAEEGRKIVDLVGGLYRFSEARHLDPDELEPVSLHFLFESLVREAGRAGLGVTMAPSPDCTVLGSSRLIREMFYNIVRNASKYNTSPQPTLAVWSEIDAGFLTVYLKDNGVGLSPSEQGKIWGLYARIRPDLSEGTGVGLALCRSIAERHGGAAGVESDGHGRGCTFWVRLPAAPVQEES